MPHPPLPEDPRLASQLRFSLEIDRLKGVERRTLLTDGSRRENSAEHSWHLGVMALLLAEHADAPVDVARVTAMVLVHDLVEIEAGDTFSYDEVGMAEKEELERRAAERLFGLLPEDQRLGIRALWDEFEERRTPEARFAHAVDRLQPILHNMATEGHSWRLHGVRRDQVEARVEAILDGAPRLGRYVLGLLEEAERRGWFPAAGSPAP